MSKFAEKLRAKRSDRENRKANRKATRDHIKKTTGKGGVEQAVDKVSKFVDKASKTKAGKVIKKVVRTVKKGKDSNLYKVAKGARDTVSNIKKGKIGEAIRTVAATKKSLNKKPNKGK